MEELDIMNLHAQFSKKTCLLFYLLMAILVHGCTFQTGSPTQAVVNSSEDTAVVTTSLTENEGDESDETGEKPVGTTDVFVPEAVTTLEPDPFKSIILQDQTVYFWYFLPPQSPIDLALNQVVDLFNEQNPYNIFIDAYNQSTSAEIISRTLPIINTADVPGLIMTDPDLVYQLREGLADLNLFLDSPSIGFTPEELANFNQQMIAQGQYAGWSESLFAFPMSRNVEIINYNLEWLSELDLFSAPATLEQLHQTGCLASSRPMQRSTTTDTTGIVLVPSLATFDALTTAYGGSLYQPEDSTFKVNSDASIAAMGFLKELYQAGCMEIYPDSTQSAEAFSQAVSPYFIGPATEFLQIESLNAANLSFSWDASGIPGVEAASLPTIEYGYNFSIPGSTPEQMVAAWMFIKFFQTSEAQRIWIQATSEYPLSRTVSANFLMPAAYWKIFNQLKDAPTLPAYPLIDEVNQRVVNSMRRILAGANTETALNLLQSSLDRLTLDFYSSQE